MLDESSDFYLSDSSSTTSSTNVHTNNTSGDEPENNNQNQLYSLITLQPSTDNISPHHNDHHLITTELQLLGGLADQHNHLGTNGNSNEHNSNISLPTLTPLKDRCSTSIPNANSSSLISVDIIGSSSASGSTPPCSNGECGDTMLLETVSMTNGQMDNVSQEVSTTTVVNGNGQIVDAMRRKNPVGRRKLILSAKEKTLRRLESNERERLRMHSLNQAFMVVTYFINFKVISAFVILLWHY